MLHQSAPLRGPLRIWTVEFGLAFGEGSKQGRRGRGFRHRIMGESLSTSRTARGRNSACGGIIRISLLLCLVASIQSVQAEEELSVTTEDVVFAPNLKLTPDYQAHAESILDKRQTLCGTIPMAAYPEVDDFFGIRFGQNDALDKFQEEEKRHYRQLLDERQYAQAADFAEKVKQATGELRSRYPLVVQPGLQLKSWQADGKSVVEVSLEAPSMAYRMEGRLGMESGKSVLYLTVIRPSDQELFVAEQEAGPVTLQVEADQPLPKTVTVKWRVLFDPLPFDLAFEPLGEVALY